MARRIVPTTELLDLIERRVVAGEATATVAGDIGVTARTVRNWFDSAGRRSPSQAAVQARRSRLDDVVWLGAARERSETVAAIAGATASSIQEVRDAYIRLNFDRARSTDDDIADAYIDGESIRSIANRLRVDRQRVRAVVRRHHLRNHHFPQRPADLDDRDTLHEQIIEQREPVASVAERLGVSGVTVRRALRRHGIRLVPRPRHGRRVGPQLDDRAWLRRRYIDEQATIADIAAEIGVGTSTVHRALISHRIPRRRAGTRRAHPLLSDRKWLQRRYLDGRRTQQQIADELNLTSGQVARALRRFGIHRPFRTRVLIDPDWLWVTHRQRDVSIPRMARWLKVPEPVLIDIIELHGIDVRHRPADYNPGPDMLDNIEWLEQRRVADHASAEMIAEQLDVRILDVRRALRDAGVIRHRSTRPQ